jgi:hypothetical protein
MEVHLASFNLKSIVCFFCFISYSIFLSSCSNYKKHVIDTDAATLEDADTENYPRTNDSASKEQDLNSLDEDSIGSDIDNVSNDDCIYVDTTPPQIKSIYPAKDSENIEVSDNIIFEFSEEMDPKTNSKENFKIIRIDTGEELEFRISYIENKVILDPVSKIISTEQATSKKGLNTSLLYKVEFSKSLKDLAGNTLDSQFYSWQFSTADLDFGLYWFGSDGEFEKYIIGKENRFYDPEKPVMVHAHGWLPFTVDDDFHWKENPFIYHDKYCDINTAQFWKTAGYNIAYLNWMQFSDSINLKAVEEKIWTSDQTGEISYYTRDGSKKYKTEIGIAEHMFNLYKKALKNQINKNIRVSGHSLGNQVVSAISEKVMESVEKGEIDEILIPRRITLLDPYWSKFGKSYLENQTNAEKVKNIIEQLITKYDTVGEFYKTTIQGGPLVGDENKALKQLTANFRVWADFINIILDPDKQHSYAVAWYFWSLSADINADNNGFVGANATNEEIKSVMNHEKNEFFHWESDGDGNDTNNPTDDTFIRKDGESSW